MKFFWVAFIAAAILNNIFPSLSTANVAETELKPTAPAVQAQKDVATSLPNDTEGNNKPPAEPAKPVIKKINPPVKAETPLRVIWPQDFYYYTSSGEPYYNLSLPKDFGTDPLSDLPAKGPMLLRAQSNTLLLSFTAATSDPVRANVFSQAFKTRTEIPLPPLGPNEEYEYLPPPRYAYHADTAALDLPRQITSAKIIDVKTGRTAENLLIQYLYLSCTADGKNCMLLLSRSERNGKAFEGFFIFPYAEKHNYIPLATFTAQSLRVKP